MSRHAYGSVFVLLGAPLKSAMIVAQAFGVRGAAAATWERKSSVVLLPVVTVPVYGVVGPNFFGLHNMRKALVLVGVTDVLLVGSRSNATPSEVGMPTVRAWHWIVALAVSRS